MRQSFTKDSYVCGRSLKHIRHGEIPKIVGRMDERWKKIKTKHTVMKAEKLELKSAMKVDEECQSGSNNMWEKVVKKFYKEI